MMKVGSPSRTFATAQELACSTCTEERLRSVHDVVPTNSTRTWPLQRLSRIALGANKVQGVHPDGGIHQGFLFVNLLSYVIPGNVAWCGGR